jgi:K+-transporting ATPase c subunit
MRLETYNIKRQQTLGARRTGKLQHNIAQRSIERTNWQHHQNSSNNMHEDSQIPLETATGSQRVLTPKLAIMACLQQVWRVDVGTHARRLQEATNCK